MKGAKMDNTDDILTFTTPETRFLSNFYPYKTKTGEKYPHQVHVIYDDIEFDCVENAYQAAKLIDKDEQLAFSKMTPYETKEIMDSYTKEIRTDWNEIKLSIMEDLVRQKFTNSPALATMLLQTHNALLIEGNTWDDTFWGVCNGTGQNNLGKILMKVRSSLQRKNFQQP